MNMREVFGSAGTLIHGVPQGCSWNWYQLIKPIFFRMRSISRSSRSF
jgi:hypothetical protein